MRIRNNSNAENELKAFSRYIYSKEDLQKIIKENKGKKINLEIGMGKGQFIINSAYQNKGEIFIGVELCKSVLALALKKLKRFEQVNGELTNLYFMSFDAKNLLEYFEEKQIDTLFLNFSDPWPKSRHYKRRLTYSDFLDLYKKVLKEGSYLNFKTDNRGLFEFSLKSMNNYNMYFEEVYLDLHKTNQANIMTEYEEKFSKNGPIYKIVCKF